MTYVSRYDKSFIIFVSDVVNFFIKKARNSLKRNRHPYFKKIYLF
jgi:hypothetical protein